MAGCDVDVGFRVVGGDAAAHALLDLASHGQEGLLDVAGVLGRRLEEGDTKTVGEFLGGKVSCTFELAMTQHPRAYLGHCVLDNLLVRHIALVAHEQLVDALGGVPVDLLQPLLDVIEAVHVGDVVDNADAVGTAVVGRCDRAEPFLAGGIPLCSSQLMAPSSPYPSLLISRLERSLWKRTICSFTVLPSSSIVRIFCDSQPLPCTGSV